MFIESSLNVHRSGMVEAVAREMLLGGWLKLYLLEQEKCPQSTARWLFQMVAHCEDVALAQAACTLLAQVQPYQMWCVRCFLITESSLNAH
jgi:hypothetical protein